MDDPAVAGPLPKDDHLPLLLEKTQWYRFHDSYPVKKRFCA